MGSGLDQVDRETLELHLTGETRAENLRDTLEVVELLNLGLRCKVTKWAGANFLCAQCIHYRSPKADTMFTHHSFQTYVTNAVDLTK